MAIERDTRIHGLPMNILLATATSRVICKDYAVFFRHYLSNSLLSLTRKKASRDIMPLSPKVYGITYHASAPWVAPSLHQCRKTERSYRHARKPCSRNAMFQVKVRRRPLYVGLSCSPRNYAQKSQSKQGAAVCTCSCARNGSRSSNNATQPECVCFARRLQDFTFNRGAGLDANCVECLIEK